MKNRLCFITLLVTTIALTAPLYGAWAGAAGYNPAMTYEGKYTKDVVYLRNRNNPNWYQGRRGVYPQNVLCRDALRSFSINGKWKGHFRADGSCGSTAEPTEFALGNRLNYDDSVKRTR